MKIAMIIVRTLLGLFLLFASVSYLFKLFPMQQPTGAVKVYSDGLAVVNLMLYVKVIELICGLAFVSGRFVTLAAVVLFPIAINIVLFHAVTSPAQIGGGLFVFLADCFLPIIIVLIMPLYSKQNNPYRVKTTWSAHPLSRTISR